jgi:uncharacterized protein YajQ (UPF0234 family)
MSGRTAGIGGIDMSEKVVIVGVNREGESFAACLKYKDDDQLEKEVYGRFECDDFLVFYEENMDELDDALDSFYAVKCPKKLDPPDVKCIGDMVCQGDFGEEEVADNYGVSCKTVKNICKERKNAKTKVQKASPGSKNRPTSKRR